MTSDQGNDRNGGHRLAPRPVSRPPVDPASRQAFSRPDGLQGSFVAERVRPQKYRDQAEFTPARSTRRPGPVGGIRSSVRRSRFAAAPPHRCGRAGRRERRTEPDEPEDPWRDPGAAAALGDPAVAPSAARGRRRATAASSACATCCSAGKVSYLALAVLLLIALVIGLIGGVIGRKTAEVVEAFTTSKVTLSTNGNSRSAGRPVRQGGGRGR